MTDRIDALRALEAVDAHGGFTAAARALHVGQPTVSKWIAALERELGARLVDRNTRRAALTPSGRSVLAHGRELLAAWEASRAAALGNALAGRVNVSLPAVLGARFVTPILARAAAAQPGLDLSLQLSDAYVDVAAGRVDLAVRVGAEVPSALRRRALADSTRCLVAAPAYVDARGLPEEPEAIEAHDVLVHAGVAAQIWQFRPSHPGRKAMKRRETVHVRGRPRASADHSEALRALALEGLGVALLADWLVAPDIEAGRLVRLLPNWRAPAAPIVALMPAESEPPARVRYLVDALADALPAALPRVVSPAAPSPAPRPKRKRARTRR